MPGVIVDKKMGVVPVDEAIERQLLNIIMDEAIEKQLLNIIICQRKNQLKDEVRDHTGPHIISITLKKAPRHYYFTKGGLQYFVL